MDFALAAHTPTFVISLLAGSLIVKVKQVFDINGQTLGIYAFNFFVIGYSWQYVVLTSLHRFDPYRSREQYSIVNIVAKCFLP